MTGVQTCALPISAWFRYTLMNDEEASKVFLGDSAEILSNSNNWQDVMIK